jgi:hypothetical protein
MSQHHSPETHQHLLTKIPVVTGRDLNHWFDCLSAGPGLLRFEERVGWLRDEHDIPHGYAAAIVHEQELRRRAIRTT